MKTAKVFKQGNSQAVRLPKEFRVVETELLIKKSGDSIVLTPKKTRLEKRASGDCDVQGANRTPTA